MVMPGVRIGHGAIIASGAVVVDDVPDYGIDRLLAVAWWDWPLPIITLHLRTIMSGSIEDLEQAAPRGR